MKIGINAEALTTATPCGIQTYLSNLLRELLKIDQENEFYLFASRAIQSEFQQKETNEQSGKKRLSFSRFGFSSLFKKNKCDLAFIPKEAAPFWIDKPIVMTAYDLFYIKKYREFRHQIHWSTRMHYEMARLCCFKKAAKICAISQDCKLDLMEICKVPEKKIVVTPLAYDATTFFPRSSEEKKNVLEKFQIKKPFFLNISSFFWARKNMMGLLKAFKKIQDFGFEHELIIVGKKGPSFFEMNEYTMKNNLKVKFFSFVEKNELASLLSACSAMVFPSFHEGYGLPIIEAMACGVPVITSNTSAMPEAAGEAALLIDPYQPEEIAFAMKRVVEEKFLADELRKKGLERAKLSSWQFTANRTLEAIHSV